MDLPLRILPGDGIVVRSGAFLGAAPGEFDSEAAQRIETIFGSYEQSENSWEHLVRTVATSIIEANFADHPPVVAALVEGASVRVFVYGAATLKVAVSDGQTHVLDGASTSTWIDQVIQGELLSISAGDEEALGVDLSGARGALEAGIVPGAGFAATTRRPAVMHAAAVATAAPSAPAAPQPLQDSEVTIEPTPLPETVADAASTLLADPEPAEAAPAVAAVSQKLDQEFRPDVTATIGPNELAEIRAAVAAHPKSEPPPPPAPVAPAAVVAPPPPPAPSPQAVEPAPPPPPVEEPTISAPRRSTDDEPAIDLRDLPPPPAENDRRTPELSPDTLSVERSPYAPPVGEAPPAPVAEVARPEASTKRRGIFAAVPDPRENKAAQSGAVTVAGVRCPQGHLNRMQSSSCAMCGSAIDPSSAIEQGERPALGQLRFDDGQLYPLDRPYVLGRRPESSAAGIGIIVIDDERHMVSKRHAEIRIVGWDVKIVDLGSSNGTKVFPPGGSAQQAIRLRPNVEVVLEAGSHIQVGERTFQYLTEGSR